MAQLKKRDPVDAIQLPWPVTIHIDGRRPKPFPAGSVVVRNRSDGDVYILPPSKVLALYDAADHEGEKLVAQLEDGGEDGGA